MFKNLKPLGNLILIKREVVTERKTESGLIINVDPVNDTGPARGTVIAVGHGTYYKDVLVPIEVSVGDEILFERYKHIELDDAYSVVREQDVLAKIEKRI